MRPARKTRRVTVSDLTRERAVVDALAICGGQMANVFFNWAQNEGFRFTEQERAMMRGTQGAWDERLRWVREARRKVGGDGARSTVMKRTR